MLEISYCCERYYHKPSYNVESSYMEPKNTTGNWLIWSQRKVVALEKEQKDCQEKVKQRSNVKLAG